MIHGPRGHHHTILKHGIAVVRDKQMRATLRAELAAHRVSCIRVRVDICAQQGCVGVDLQLLFFYR